VFLKVVPYTGNIGGYLSPMGKPDPGHFTKGRIRLFWGYGHNPGTNPTFLGTGMKSRGLCLGSDLLPSKTDQLVNGRHAVNSLNVKKHHPENSEMVNLRPQKDFSKPGVKNLFENGTNRILSEYSPYQYKKKRSSPQTKKVKKK
jgi:hypothetical protein